MPGPAIQDWDSLGPFRWTDHQDEKQNNLKPEYAAADIMEAEKNPPPRKDKPAPPYLEARP